MVSHVYGLLVKVLYIYWVLAMVSRVYGLLAVTLVVYKLLAAVLWYVYGMTCLWMASCGSVRCLWCAGCDAICRCTTSSGKWSHKG